MHRNTSLLAALLLAACGSEPSGDAARAPAPDSAAAPSAAPPTAGGAGDSTPAAPVAARPTVILAPDGVEIANGAGAPARLAFGAARDTVLGRVGALMNGPGKQAEQEECPAGPLTTTQYPSGLQLVFQEGKFVGWAAEPGSTLRTAPGIGPGSTLGQLRAAYPAATVDESSLGMEFVAGDLYGIVSDSTAAGQVEIMFAGINCIFR
jgi:hypothetical protein